MSVNRHLRRTNLFLVRVWTEEESASAEPAAMGDNPARWHGKVQRVVDGNSYQFSGWQGLVDLLLTLVSEADGKQQLDNTHRDKKWGELPPVVEDTDC